MLVVMDARATEEQVRAVCQRIESRGLRAIAIPGMHRVAIAVAGHDGSMDAGALEGMPGVLECILVSKPYKLASRNGHADGTTLHIATPLGDVSIGDSSIAVIGGPCAIESREQAFTIAGRVKSAGARLFRGGAYKPRTSPYSFQGLGEPGLEILRQVRDQFGLGIVTEAVDGGTTDLIEPFADVIQIGSRNMQNFSLLKRAGQARKPILLKRGMSATLDEFLMAAEYIMAEGNTQVILCERGVRTFNDHTRNTLDLGIVPAVHRRSHLPIVVDPSHGTGRRLDVAPMARAAVAVGADGLLIEVHHAPEAALSDGRQAILPEDFDALITEARLLAGILGRAIN
jgi:3-deoxy-7-phosphoheptulonate synthase